MTNLQLLSVCCRAFGIFLAFSTLPMFFAFFNSLNLLTSYDLAADPYAYFGWMFYLVSPVLLLALAGVMFFAPGNFARNLLSAQLGENRKSNWSADELQAIAFSTVGLYLLASAAVNAHNWFEIIRVIDNLLDYSVGTKPGFPQSSPYVIEHVLKIGVGFWLLLGAGGLSTLVRTWRTARLSPPASDADGTAEPEPAKKRS